MGTGAWAGRQAEIHHRRGGAADTLIPQPSSPLAWDRYAYARNNPLRYTDPSGHFSLETLQRLFGVSNLKDSTVYNNLSANAQTFLKSDSASFGDIISYEDGGKIHRVALTQHYETGELVLWDVDNQKAVDTGLDEIMASENHIWYDYESDYAANMNGSSVNRKSFDDDFPYQGNAVKWISKDGDNGFVTKRPAIDNPLGLWGAVGSGILGGLNPILGLSAGALTLLTIKEDKTHSKFSYYPSINEYLDSLPRGSASSNLGPSGLN